MFGTTFCSRKPNAKFHAPKWYHEMHMNANIPWSNTDMNYKFLIKVKCDFSCQLLNFKLIWKLIRFKNPNNSNFCIRNTHHIIQIVLLLLVCYFRHLLSNVCHIVYYSNKTFLSNSPFNPCTHFPTNNNTKLSAYVRNAPNVCLLNWYNICRTDTNKL